MNGYVSGKSLVSLNDKCVLVAETYKIDANGIQQPTESLKTVWCGKISIGANEFYKAAAEGLKIELILVIYAIEYEGETAVIFNNNKYPIKRTYERTDGLLELHCIAKVGVENGSD